MTYHFHWSHDDVMAMEHAERQQWVAEISALHREMNGAPT